MNRKRLLAHLYPTILLILITALGLLGWYSVVSLEDFYLSQTRQDLKAEALLIEQLLAGRWKGSEHARLERLVKNLGEKTTTRITLIRADGRVIADSNQNPLKMDNHARRPEVRTALSGRTGSSLRFSRTLQTRMMYLAVPARDAGGISGVVRIAIPVGVIQEVLSTARSRIFVGIFMIALLAAGSSLIVYRRISRPLQEMKQGAERFAGGELDYRLPIPDSGEIGGLAVALNRMAEQLKERIETILRQRNEQEALFAGMVESVLAVDLDRRILSMNRAAEEMFGISAGVARGRSLQEIVRNVDLHNFYEKVLRSGETLEEDLLLFTEGERNLQAHGTILRDAGKRRSGVLIVLNDVTRIRRLEKVRRDFFDNVSHELKTPITSIKGYVETLLNGESHNTEDVQRFLRIVSDQTDRLTTLIEDLLSLSRIEQGAERGGIHLHPDGLLGVIRGAVRNSEEKAASRGIGIQVDCDPALLARINPNLLEQALSNLIDNAVKYGDPNGTIRVECARAGAEIELRVVDRGIGIAAEHHERLFERFYRVDKARSRREGGTGLGLAIVKHIAEAHGGRVAVESVPGQGSVFSIFLPCY